MSSSHIQHIQPHITLMGLLLAGVLAVSAAGAESSSLSDNEIATAIETHYLMDRTVDENAIDVRVTDGIVELSGEAGNLLAKQRAARIAEQVRGVRAVSNRIRVTPSPMMTDEGLRQAVLKTLASDRAVEGYQIEVGVHNGVVTLDGVVDSLAERSMAERLTKRVRGVVAVNNQIGVEFEQERPDEEIQAGIQARLRSDILIDDELIEVEVNDGRVVLRGTVGSLAEKRQAVRDSHLQGVRSVDADALDVDTGVKRPALRGAKYAARTHEQIVAAVKDALRSDPRVRAERVEAEVSAGGWVTLRGAVENLRAKRVAERLARHTVGVISVSNLIKVRPELRPSDAQVENRIYELLNENPLTEAEDIDVGVNAGQVLLTGSVRSYAARHAAEDEASTVTGVIDVINDLKVAAVPQRPDAYFGFDEGAGPDVPADRLRTDTQIEAAVRRQMRWSPYVDAEDVEVSVTEGGVSLEGKVDTWREYHAAEEQAREGGAARVRNRLEVP